MRYLKHILVLLFIKLPVQLAGAIILAIYLPFHGKKEYLPKYLKWFDNSGVYQNNMKFQLHVTDGLSGGPSYRKLWKKPEGFLARYVWLGWRNPVNYFQTFVLGFPGRIATRAFPKIDYYPSPDGYNHYRIDFVNSKPSLWEYSYFKPIGLGLALRARIGYKIKHDDGLAMVGSQRPAQWVFSIGLRGA